MKVWYKLVLENEWLIGHLQKDDLFCGGWKIECEDGISIHSISIVKDFKMYKTCH